MPFWTGENPLIDNTDYFQAEFINEFRSYLNGGWMKCNNWTMNAPLSESTPSGQAPRLFVSFEGDATPYMSIGDKVQFTPPFTSVTYGYLVGISVSSGVTSLTIVLDGSITAIGGAGTILTSCAFSKSPSPNGFPSSLTWTPVFTPGPGMTFTSTTLNWAKFNLVGRAATFNLNVTGTIGGTPSTYIDLTPPIPRGNGDYFAPLGDGYISPGSFRLAWVYWANVSTTLLGINYYDGRSFTAGANTISMEGAFSV
jgi:hypothetical protein